MQGLSSKTFEGLARRLGQARRLGLEARSVGGVPQHRMAGVGEVDADLVGAAGFQPALDQARYGLVALLAVLAAEALQHLPMGDGGAALGADRHPVAALGMAIDRRVDGALLAGGRAPDEGEI